MSPFRIIDLSHTLDPETPVYPGYPPVEISILESTKEILPDRPALNSSRISIGLHCGTHMDAPFHFFENARTIDQVPLQSLVGPALLVDMQHLSAHERIEKDHLLSYQAKLEETQKVVLKTGWSHNWGKPGYFSEHPVMSTEAAQFLVDCDVHLVGIDTPSVDLPPFPVHFILLSNDVVIVENLTNLEAINYEIFQLVVLPLKITARDGSPVRAIAWEL